jgi:hypothetical protein
MTPRRYGPLAYAPITRRPKPRNRNQRVPRVMAIAVHPFVAGQLRRIGAMDAALE